MYIQRVKVLLLSFFMKMFNSNHFIKIIQRPKRLNLKVHPFSYIPNKNILSTAIILQGPIIYKDNFTLESLKLYRSFYPEAIIVLSTWNGVNVNFINLISKINIHLIESTPPPMPGPFNINLQLVSTFNAIKYIEKYKVDYILKTRTDQRFYNINTLNYLHNLVINYSLTDKKHNQQSRIITCSMNTFKFRMYGVSDMFLFGTLSDIKKYFSVNLDLRENMFYKPLNKLTLREYANYNLCEIYLATNYLKLIGEELSWTLSDSFLKLKNHFCIIDQNSIDLYWEKYSMLEYRFKIYKDINLMEELTFNDWLLLYTSDESACYSDEILEVKL
jgi:hypothetical protein